MQEPHAITDFRAKLLALLPIASGSGIVFLLTKRSEPIDTTYLSVIDLFGFLVTLALFIYELRGIQHCKALNHLASRLEQQLHLRDAQFHHTAKGPVGRLCWYAGRCIHHLPHDARRLGLRCFCWLQVACTDVTGHRPSRTNARKAIVNLKSS